MSEPSDKAIAEAVRWCEEHRGCVTFGHKGEVSVAAWSADSRRDYSLALLDDTLPAAVATLRKRMEGEKA